MATNSLNAILTIFCLQWCFSCTPEPLVDIEGELKKWHRVTLVFEGPESSEMAENNPFLNYRLDVTFINGQEKFTVPGFYAADGNAAETSADSGNKWMVRFTPDQTGEWHYQVSFKQGADIAVSDPETVPKVQSAGYFDGTQGTFTIGPNDKTGSDNRARGRLSYVGEPYLKYQESGKYFIKVGVDAPENLFAYEDFDATPNVFDLRKQWQPHQKDFETQAAGFRWQGEKGRNLLGAINYLASEGLNVLSFLTFTIDGDDRNVFPYLLKVP
jgi:hypothetical protein